MSEQLDLRKRIVLDLKKKKGLEGQVASVILVLDKSGSMSNLYKNGFVQRLVERVLPVGLGFDDDGEVELYVFHSSAYRHKTNISRGTLSSIVPDVIKQYGYEATEYANPIKLILDQWIGPKSSGFLGMGSKTRPSKKLLNPLYVIFVTDGENSDKSETEEVLREASNYPIFFQFVGIGNERFNFLRKLDDLSGRVVDNANFFQANDLDGMSDEDLYDKLMTEFPDFIQNVRSKGWIS
jgi:hypothetical protein